MSDLEPTGDGCQTPGCGRDAEPGSDWCYACLHGMPPAPPKSAEERAADEQRHREDLQQRVRAFRRRHAAEYAAVEAELGRLGLTIAALERSPKRAKVPPPPTIAEMQQRIAECEREAEKADRQSAAEWRAKVAFWRSEIERELERGRTAKKGAA